MAKLKASEILQVIGAQRFPSNHFKDRNDSGFLGQGDAYLHRRGDFPKISYRHKRWEEFLSDSEASPAKSAGISTHHKTARVITWMSFWLWITQVTKRKKHSILKISFAISFIVKSYMETMGGIHKGM